MFLFLLLLLLSQQCVVHTEIITVSALNREAELGLVYDAETDNLLPISALKSALPNGSTMMISKTDTVSEFKVVKNKEDRLKSIGLSVEAQLSVLTGTVSASGAISIANHESSNSNSIQAVLSYRTSVVFEILHIRLPTVRSVVSLEPLQQYTKGTHVIIGVEYGAQINCNVEADISQNSTETKVAAELTASFSSITTSFQAHTAVSANTQGSSSASSLRIACYSDLHLPFQPTSVEQAFELISMTPSLLAETVTGKGVPQTFKAVKFNTLTNILHMDGLAFSSNIVGNRSNVLNPNDALKFGKLLLPYYNEYDIAHKEIFYLKNTLSGHHDIFNQTVLNEVEDIVFNFEATANVYNDELRELLSLAKRGFYASAKSLLIDSQAQMDKNKYSSTSVRKLISTKFAFTKSKLNYKRIFSNHGIYFMNRDSTTDEIIIEHSGKEVVFLFYRQQWRLSNKKIWTQLADYMIKMKKGVRLIVDCDDEYLNDHSCKPESPFLLNNTFFIVMYNNTGKYNLFAENEQVGLKWKWDTGIFPKI